MRLPFVLGLECDEQDQEGRQKVLLKITVSFGFALALVGTLAMEATAQSSCSGWNSTCRARCGKASCPYCDEQMRNCVRTGCWAEAARFGGARHCNLQKR